MRAIFVSYRRSDSQGEAGRLFDDLVAQFGEQKVFMDVAGIEAGVDFRKAIEESIGSCGVLLVVIGPGWTTAKDEGGRRRLDDPADFVGVEVAAALRRGIPVIPVLVRGATMPRAEELPGDLRDLAYRNCVELTHARWKSDVQLLFEPLRRLIGNSGEVKTPGSAATVAVAKSSEPARFDAATLQRVRKELALDIGPIADIVVKRSASVCNSPGELYEKVSEEIESPEQRQEFLRRVSGSSAPVPTPAKETALGPQRPVDEPTPARSVPRKKSLVPTLVVIGIVLLAVFLIVGRKIMSSAAPAPAVTSPNQSASGTDLAPGGVARSETKSQPSNAAPATAQPQRISLSPQIAEGLLVSRVAPAYPELARQAHIQGEVVLDANISTDGAVESIRTVSGHPMLVPAAIDAVKQWRYKPYLQNGAPVPVQAQIAVNFTLKTATASQ